MIFNYVTVASDASCGKEATGYAYYIRDDDGTTKKAWRTEHKKLSSTKAEIVAALSALKVINSRNYPKGTKVIYYCDNTTALQVIDDSFADRTRKRYLGAIEMAKELIGDLEIETRHVPSHTGKTDMKRYYLNKWCDINARAMMRYGRLHIARRRTR